MGLSNVLSLVESDLVANLSAPLNAVTFVTGARELTQNDAPPRIAWVRKPGTFAPSNQRGGRDPRTTGRVLRTHVGHVDAHVWAAANPLNGNDDSDTELLAHTLIASVYRVAHGCFEVLGDDWPQVGWMADGFLCIVAFRFQMPVVDVAPIYVAGPFTMPFDQSTQPPPQGVLQAPGDD